MIHAPDPLAESMRLLRETRLRPGFEERLSARLALVAQTERSSPSSAWKYKRGLFLLAAIAVPTAALAASGWLVERLRPAVASDLTPRAEVSAHPRTAAVSRPTGSAAQPVPVPVPVLPQQNVETASSRGADQARGNTRAKPAIRRSAERTSTSVSQTQSPPQAPEVSRPAPESGGARIESLDVSIPRSSTRTEQKPGTAEKDGGHLGLRSAASESASRAATIRDRSGTERDRMGEHRGNDAAQQARERVQARERKGQ